MYVRALVREIWQSAGLYESKKAKVKAFLNYFDTHPEDCWDECVATLRKLHYPVFNDIVPPLLKTDDKLLRLNLIQRMNGKNRRELGLLKSFIQETDALRDEVELVAMTKLGNKELMEEIRKRPNLTGNLKQLIQPLSRGSKSDQVRTGRTRKIAKENKKSNQRKTTDDNQTQN